MKPITRLEQFIDSIIQVKDNPEPITNVERFLQDINKGTSTIEPVTREEQFLAAIRGGYEPVPITREEQFLSAIAIARDDSLPEPITRTEFWLKAWYDKIANYTKTIAGVAQVPSVSGFDRGE